MPCPAMFNDPFDCSLDERTRLTFIECAIGCFSTVPDDVLMFSHYSDNHIGLCVGFNTRLLVQSLTAKNKPLRADIRPVWYFSKMPSLSLVTQPALCATCKHDIWGYEHEFRVFMARDRRSRPPLHLRLTERPFPKLSLDARQQTILWRHANHSRTTCHRASGRRLFNCLISSECSYIRFTRCEAPTSRSRRRRKALCFDLRLRGVAPHL